MNKKYDTTGSRILDSESSRGAFGANINVGGIFNGATEYFTDPAEGKAAAKRRIRQQLENAIGDLIECIQERGKEGISRIHLRAVFAFDKEPHSKQNITDDSILFEGEEQTFKVEVSSGPATPEGDSTADETQAAA